MEKVTDCHIKIFLTAPKTHQIEQGTKGGNVKRKRQKKIKSGKRKIKHELGERSWNARDEKARRLAKKREGREMEKEERSGIYLESWCRNKYEESKRR